MFEGSGKNLYGLEKKLKEEQELSKDVQQKAEDLAEGKIDLPPEIIQELEKELRIYQGYQEELQQEEELRKRSERFEREERLNIEAKKGAVISLAAAAGYIATVLFLSNQIENKTSLTDIQSFLLSVSGVTVVVPAGIIAVGETVEKIKSWLEERKEE